MIKVTVSSDPAATVSAGTIVRSESGGGGAGIVIDSTLTQSGQAADAAVVGNRLSALSEEKVALPTDADGNTILGTAGWYAVSDGAGGITWVESAPSTGGGGETTTHGIVWDLVNVSSSNAVASVNDGASLTAVLTPADGYALGDVTITMGGEVITGAWNADTATVTIASVTGDVIISCAGVAQDVTESLSIPYIGWSGSNYNNTSTVDKILSGVSKDEPAPTYSYWMVETTKAGTLEITFDDTISDGFNLGVVLYGSDGSYVGGSTTSYGFVNTSNIGYGTVSGSPLIINIPDGFNHSYILIRVRKQNGTGFSNSSEFTSWVVTSLNATLKIGTSSETESMLSVDDDIAMNYSVATTSILGEETEADTNTAYGISSSLAAVIDEVRSAWMTEYGGDFRKIPLIITTDQHGRTNSGIFNMLGAVLNMHDISKIMNLGDTVSNEWYDADTEYPLRTNATLDAWLDSIKVIPFSKRLDVYGNHDTWYGNYTDDGNTVGTRYPGSQAHLYQYFRNIYARRTNNNGWFTVYDDMFNVKYVVISGFEYQNDSVALRIGTAQMTWLIEELSKNDGYDVVIISHVPLLFDPDTVTMPTGQVTNESLHRVSNINTDAFFSARQTKGSGTITDSDGVEHNYDFSGCASPVLCSLHGHTHEDAYLYLDDKLLVNTFDWFADNTFFMVLIDRVNRQLNVWKIEAPDGVPTYLNYQIPLDKPAE